MFVLITKKQKEAFVKGIVNSVECALTESGRKMAVSTRFNLRMKLNKLVHLSYNSKKEKAIVKKCLGVRYEA